MAAARAIAADCGMTKLLAVLGRPRQDEQDQPGRPGSGLTIKRENDLWLVGFAGIVTRIPNSLGLRYLDLLIRQPGHELAALDLVQTVAAAGPAGASPAAS